MFLYNKKEVKKDTTINTEDKLDKLTKLLQKRTNIKNEIATLGKVSDGSGYLNVDYNNNKNHSNYMHEYRPDYSCVIDNKTLRRIVDLLISDKEMELASVECELNLLGISI